MSWSAIAFMAGSWACVLGLLTFCYVRILTHRKHHDPDGIGPAVPEEAGMREGPKG